MGQGQVPPGVVHPDHQGTGDLSHRGGRHRLRRRGRYPELACGWANREIIGKRYPTIYCNESTLEEVLKEMATHYTDRVRDRDYGIWLAHPGSPPVVPNECQAIQYQWEGTYDVSVALPTAPFLKPGDPL